MGLFIAYEVLHGAVVNHNLLSCSVRVVLNAFRIVIDTLSSSRFLLIATITLLYFCFLSVVTVLQLCLTC